MPRQPVDHSSTVELCQDGDLGEKHVLHLGLTAVPSPMRKGIRSTPLCLTRCGGQLQFQRYHAQRFFLWWIDGAQSGEQFLCRQIRGDISGILRLQEPVKTAIVRHPADCDRMAVVQAEHIARFQAQDVGVTDAYFYRLVSAPDLLQILLFDPQFPGQSLSPRCT
jgi:hypothetical protein